MQTRTHEPAVGLSPWVERSRLTAHLDATACCPITLVCGPAGWGKTVMLTEWRRAFGEKVPVLWYCAATDEGVGDGELWRRIVGDLTERGVLGPEDSDPAGP